MHAQPLTRTPSSHTNITTTAADTTEYNIILLRSDELKYPYVVLQYPYYLFRNVFVGIYLQAFERVHLFGTPQYEALEFSQTRINNNEVFQLGTHHFEGVEALETHHKMAEPPR